MKSVSSCESSKGEPSRRRVQGARSTDIKKIGMEGSAAPNGGSYPAITEQEGRVPLLQHRDGGEKKRMDLLPFLHISVFGILVTLGIGSVVVGILAEYYNYVVSALSLSFSIWCASAST